MPKLWESLGKAKHLKKITYKNMHFLTYEIYYTSLNHPIENLPGWNILQPFEWVILVTRGFSPQ